MNSLVTGLPTGLESMRPMRYLAEVNSQSLPETHPVDTEIEYLDIGAVGHGEILFPPERMAFGAAPSRARRVVQKDDILVSTVRTYLRAVARIAEPPDNLVASTGFAVLRARPDVVDSRFLFYWCLSDHFIESVVSKSTGVSYPAINASELLAMPVFCPPLDVQRRIADLLDAETARIDTLIEKNHLLITGLQRRFSSQLEQSLTAWAVGDITVPRSVQAAAERAPAGWHATRLEAITTAVQDRVSLAEMADAGDVVHYTIEELGNTGRPRTDSGSDIGSDKLRVRGDELLISRLNPRKGHVFEVTPHEGLAVASGEFAIMRPRDGITTRRFLFYYLTTPLIRASLDAGVQSATKSQQRVSFDRIWQTAIALPPLSEQHRLAALLDESRSRIDGLCLCINQQTALLRLRRQALITAAVTGQIEV